MGSDVKLIFGVDGVDKGGKSYDQIKGDLETVITNIGTVKFKLAVDDKALSAIKGQIQDLVKFTGNVNKASAILGGEDELPIQHGTSEYYKVLKLVNDELTKVEMTQYKFREATNSSDANIKEAYSNLEKYQYALLEMEERLDGNRLKMSDFSLEFTKQRGLFADTSEVLKSSSEKIFGSDTIKAGTVEYTKALTQISNAIKSVQDRQAQWEASASGTKDMLRANISEYSATADILKDYKTEVESGTVTTKEFAEVMSFVKSELAKTGQSSAELINVEKFKVDVVSAQTQLEGLRQSLINTKREAERFKDGGDTFVKEAHITRINELSEAVENLASKLEHEPISKTAFSEEFRALSLDITKAKNDLSNFLNDGTIVSGSTEYYDAMRQIQSELSKVELAQLKFREATSSGDENIKQAYASLDVYRQSLKDLDDGLSTGEMKMADFSQELAKQRYMISASAAVLQQNSKDIFGTEAIEAGTVEYTQALTQISTMLKSVGDMQTSWSTSVAGTNGSLDKSIATLESSAESISAFENRVRSGEVSAKEFTATMSAFRSEIAKASEEASGIINAEKLNVFAGNDKIKTDTVDYTNALSQVASMLKKVQDMQTSWSTSLAGTKGLLDGNISELSASASLIQEFSQKMQTGEVTTREFAETMSFFKSEIAQADAAASKIINIEKLNAFGGNEKIKADTVEYTNALASVASMLKSVQDMQAGWSSSLAGTRGMLEDSLVELAVEEESLKEFDQRLRDGNVTAKEFTDTMSSFKNALAQTSVNASQIINTEKMKADVTGAQNQLENLSQSLIVVRRNAEKFRTDDNTFITDAHIQRIDELREKINELSTRLNSGSLTGTAFGEEFKSLSLEVNKTKNTIDNFLKDSPIYADVDNAVTSIVTLKDSLETAASKARLFDGGAESGTGGFVANIENVMRSLDELRTKVENGMERDNYDAEMQKIKRSATEAKSALDAFYRSQKEAESGIIVSGTQQYNKALGQTDDLMGKLVAAQIKYSKYQSSTNGDIKASYGALSGYASVVASLRKQLETGKLSQADFTKEIERLSQATLPAINQLDQYSNSTATLSQQVNNVTTRIGGMFTGYMLLRRGMSTIREMINEAIELDDAMTQMRIVTKATGEQMVEFGDNISAAAQRVAAPITDLVDATTTFARLGYDMDSASKLAEFTGMLQQVGDISADSAQDAITSIMKAFPKDADIKNIESIMDRLVATGNGFPVSVSQLALGMTNASSALAAAGNSFDQSVALLTAANVTIQDASKSSTGLRTIAARIRNTKTELDALGETENFAKYDKLVQALTRYNVALTDVTGQYRSTFDILQDIAKIWDQLDTMEQAALATQLAGTRQQAVFYSIIEQFKDAEGAMEAMQNSAGTLEESYAYYLDSMSAHVNTFKNAWVDLSATIAEKGTVTTIVDMGTAIVNVANKLAKMHMLLPAISASIIAIRATLQFIKKEAAFANVSKSISALAPESLKAATSQQILAESTANLTRAQKEAIASTIVQKLETSGMSKEDAAATIAKMGLATATKAEVAANNSLAASIRGVLATNPIGWIMLLASLIVPAVQKIHDMVEANKELKKSFDDFQDDLDKSKEATDQVVNNFRDLKSSVDEVLPKFNELAKGVDSYGRNVSLTDAEYSEFIDLQNRLGDLLPDIVMYIDDNGNKILDLDNVTANYNETIKEQISLQRELAQIDIVSHMDEAMDAMTGQTDILTKRMEVLKAIRDGIKRGGIIDTSNIVDAEDVEYFNKTLEQLGVSMSNITNATATSLTIDLSSFDVERMLGNISAFEADMGAKIGDVWSGAAEYANAYFKSSPEYEAMSEEMRLFFDKIVSGLDYSEAGVRTSEDLKRFIEDEFIKPIQSMTPETQDALSKMINVKEAFISGTIGAKEYISALDGIKRQLSAQGVDDNLTDKILGTLDDNQIRSKFNTIRNGIRGSKEEVDAFLNGLPAGDLEILYSIVPANGSITMDEAVTKLEDIKNLQTEFLDASETLNISGMFSDLEDVSGRIDSVTSSMQKLAKGTSLTTKELLKLASEYPQLLKQSNLFTDGSIAGQKKLLEAVLKCNEEQYKSTIQLKLNELKVTIDAIKKQQEVEKEKQKYLLQIYAMTLSGNIENNKQFNIAVGKLNELEAKKYAEIKGGEVKVAAASYKKIDDAAVDTTNHIIDNAYVPGGRALTETYAEAAQTTVGIVYDMHEWIRQIMTSGEEGSAADAVAIARGIADQNTMAYWYQRFNQNAVQSRASYSVSSPDDYRRGIWEEMQQSIQDSVVYDNAIRELEATYDNLSGLLDVKFDELISSVESSSNNSSGSGSDSSSSSGSDDVSRRIRDILNQLLRDLRAFYDAQKKMLKDEIEDEKYLREQAEKRKTINDIENLIAQLGVDDSAWAQKRRIALEEELKDAKEELAAFEQDKAVSQAEDMYDSEYEKQAAIINELINGTNVTVEEINGKLGEIYKLLDSSAHSVGLPYASGTSNATSGLHMIDEHGSETIFQSANGNRYRMFSGGEKVLNAGASEFLYKFASSYGKSLTHGVSGIPSGISRNGNPSISMGNIIISGNADDRTVSEIRRAQRDQIRDLLTMFGRMK